LDALNGDILWINELPGLGYQLATVCVAGQASIQIPAVVQELLNQQSSSSDAGTTTPG